MDMKAFLRERIELVKALAACEDLPVKYEDLALITCAVISACAAQRWPGRGSDKKRFVELLVQHSDSRFRTSWVSVPALLNARLIRQDQTPYGAPGNEDRIYRDEEIDLSFEDAGTKYPALTRAQLRDHCYAALIYERLRCAYVHEYRSGEDITTFPASRGEARVSYIGEVPEMTRMGRFRVLKCGWVPEIRRIIYFHLEYLIDLAQYHVSILQAASNVLPFKWWIEMP